MSRTPLAAALIALLLLPAGAHAATTHRDVTVMSRNLYLGADIITAAVAKDRADLQQRATALLGVVQQTNFPVRAKAIAKEIATTKPDLVGLQEVAQWRRTPDGVTNDVKDATVNVYDFLALLRSELKAQGASYRPAVTQTEADFEVPTAQNFDIRLTMRDVILVRTGKSAKVKVARALKGHYRNNLTVTIPIGPIVSQRGWTAVDATSGGTRFRFVNTHLEAYGGEVRDKQAHELLKGALASKKRGIILVGDLNSAPTDTGAEGLAYRTIRKGGFVDAFRAAPKTSGQDEKLDNPASKLQRYIDHIMSRPALRTVKTKVIGNRPSDRIQNLWPSDHAGTVATLRLR
jgi:endonuclease/exonuclease/phosphatase family metal-dependent hydrolase